MNLELAINELRRSRDLHAHNAPLHDLNGDAEQAELCRAVAEQCHFAILVVEQFSKAFVVLTDY